MIACKVMQIYLCKWFFRLPFPASNSESCHDWHTGLFVHVDVLQKWIHIVYVSTGMLCMHTPTLIFILSGISLGFFSLANSWNWLIAISLTLWRSRSPGCWETKSLSNGSLTSSSPDLLFFSNFYTYWRTSKIGFQHNFLFNLQEIQETLLPPSVHIYPKKKVKKMSEQLEMNGGVNQQTWNWVYLSYISFRRPKRKGRQTISKQGYCNYPTCGEWFQIIFS